MQKSGEISALIEEVRKNISKANSLSNAFNSKMKEKALLGKKEEELAKQNEITDFSDFEDIE